MGADDDAKLRAVASVTNAFRPGLRFPKNVFLAGRRTFLFFDLDRMLDRRFAGKAKELLEIEGSQCACLMDIEQPANATAPDHVRLFIGSRTSDDEYGSFLFGPDFTWKYDRFGCASNVGEWCIYFERRSEMGVLSFQEQHSLERFASVISQLGALPIKEAIEKPISFVFDPRHLLPEWRIELLKEYE